MIQNIMGTNGVNVIGGQSGSGPWVNGSYQDMSHGIHTGDLRMLGNTVYVWANGCWNSVPNPPTTIELTPEVQSILNWGRRAMAREAELDKLVKEYPAVKSAKENLDVVVALTRDYSKD